MRSESPLRNALWNLVLVLPSQAKELSPEIDTPRVQRSVWYSTTFRRCPFKPFRMMHSMLSNISPCSCPSQICSLCCLLMTHFYSIVQAWHLAAPTKTTLIPQTFLCPSYHSPLASSSLLCTSRLFVFNCSLFHSLPPSPLLLYHLLRPLPSFLLRLCPPSPSFRLCLMFFFALPSASPHTLKLTFLPFTAANPSIHMLYHLYIYLPFISNHLHRKCLLCLPSHLFK